MGTKTMVHCCLMPQVVGPPQVDRLKFIVIVVMKSIQSPWGCVQGWPTLWGRHMGPHPCAGLVQLGSCMGVDLIRVRWHPEPPKIPHSHVAPRGWQHLHFTLLHFAWPGGGGAVFSRCLWPKSKFLHTKLHGVQSLRRHFLWWISLV